MAEDTLGPVPGQTSNLQRVSQNPPHWQQARWLLIAEGAAAALIGVVGLIACAVRGWVGGGLFALGIPLTPALSAVLLIIGAAALGATTRRRVATVFTGLCSAAALALMIVCGVVAAHRDPGPLGFTEPAILLWAVLFCYNLGLGMWLASDHLEGPQWLPRRRHGALPPEQR